MFLPCPCSGLERCRAKKWEERKGLSFGVLITFMSAPGQVLLKAHSPETMSLGSDRPWLRPLKPLSGVGPAPGGAGASRETPGAAKQRPGLAKRPLELGLSASQGHQSWGEGCPSWDTQPLPASPRTGPTVPAAPARLFYAGPTNLRCHRDHQTQAGPPGPAPRAPELPPRLPADPTLLGRPKFSWAL